MTNTRKNIYCEFAFWESFKERYPTTVPMPFSQEEERYKAWRNVYSMMCRSDLCFDCSKEAFLEASKSDPYLMQFLKRHTDGMCVISFSDHYISLGVTPKNKYSIRDLCSIFLTSIGQNAAKDFGVLNITSKNYADMGMLFRDNGIAIAKEEEFSWDFLEDHARHNCNSMIIVDNYILKNHKRLKLNLEKILSVLLPESLDIPFQLSVFAICDEGKSQSWNQSEDIIQRWLKKNRPKLPYELRCHPIKKDDFFFHDRSIITNNIWISCGAGFDLFYDQNGKRLAGKSTTVNIVYPFVQNINDWTDDAYLNNIEDVNYALDDMQEDDDNRLLKTL